MDNELASLRARLAENPQDIEALTALEQALLDGADWEGLVALTAERAAQLSDEERLESWVRLVSGLEAHGEALIEAHGDEAGPVVSRLLLATARVCEEVLGQAEEAVVRAQRAFALDPGHFAALALARGIYARHEAWETVLELMNLELQHTTGEAALATMYLGMADLLAHRLDRTEDAVACVQRALALVPDHPGAKPYLGLLDAVHTERAGRIQVVLDAADKARDGRRRAAHLIEAANLWLDDDPANAEIEAILRRALEADPRNEHGRILLEQYYERNGRWEDLVAWLEQRVRQTARKSDRLATYQRLAQITQIDLRDPERAVAWHREVLSVSPVESEALNYCVDYYSERSEWQQLVEVYEAALRVRARGGNEAAMLIQIAMILWKKVEDLEAAEGYFKRIKLNDPRNGLMLNFYSHYYETRQDYKRLLSTLSTRQGIESNPGEKVALGLQMARVAEEQLDNAEKAIDVWKSVLKIDEGHAEARAALRRLLHQTQKWNALLEFLKDDLKHTPADDIAAQVAIHEQMIAIYEVELRLPVMVVNTYNQILQIDPSNQTALDALEERYESGGRFNDLIGILVRRAELAQAAGEPARVIGYYRQIAALWRDKFSNPNQAIDYLEGILALQPDDAQAIAELVEIYQHRKDWPALYQAYERKLALLEGADRTALLAEMAEIADHRLGERARAIELWEAVLSEQPDHPSARDHLEQLFQKTARFEELAALYGARAAAADEPGAQVEWLKKLAHLCADTLDDEDRAASAWHQVLALQPGDLHAESYLRELALRRADWDGLERLFERRGDWEGFLRQLSAAVDRHEAQPVRVELLRRMALVCQARMGNEAGAVECWERILQEDPDHVEAAGVLAPYYVAKEDWAAVVIVLEVILRGDPEDPVVVLADLAEVHATHLGDFPRAFECLALALQAAPGEERFLHGCVELAEAASAWEELAALLEALVAQGAPEETLRLRGVLAEILDTRLARPDAAIAHYEALRAVAGDLPELLSALESLNERQARWPALLEIREARLAAAETQAERAAILAAIGTLHETVLDDPEAARRSFEALHALDPSDLPALKGLQRLAERAGDLEGLMGHLEAERALTEGPEASAALQHRIGQLFERLADPEAALAAYAEALSLVEDHALSLAALEQFLDGPLAAEAAALLEPATRRAQRWPALRRVLGLLAEGAANRADRRAYIAEVAQLEEDHLGDRAAAFATWQRLLALDPADDGAIAALERLALELDRFDALAAHYGRFALEGDLAPEEAPLAVRFTRRQAALLEARLGRLPEARAALESILREVGDDAETLDALDALNTRLSDWRALVEICERRLGLLGEDPARLDVLFRIGDLWEELLEDPVAAIDVYRRVMGIDPANARALGALERIFRNIGRYQDLAELLEERLEAASSDAARVELSYQLGLLLAEQLTDAEGALERFGAALALDFEHEPSQEAIFQIIAEAEAGVERAVRLRACDLLEPVLTRLGDAASLISVLQVRLSETDDVEGKVALRLRTATLYETELADPNAAFGAVAAAFALDRADPRLAAELERLARAQGSWSALIEVIRGGLQAQPLLDPPSRGALLARLAVVFEEQLVDREEAVVCNQEILADRPDDLEALARLDRLYLDLGRPADLAPVLEQRLALEGAAEDRVRLAFRLGGLYQDALDRPADAVRVFAFAREDVAEDDVRAHVALERLYTQIGDFEALVEVLQDHAERVDDVAAARALRRRAAQVMEDALERPDDAVALLHQLLDEDTADGEVLAELDRLYQLLDRPADLLDILDRRLVLADAADRDALGLRIGALHRDAMEALPLAVNAFAAVLGHSPDNAEARAALEGLLDADEVRLEVSAILVPLYERFGEWGALSATLRRTLPDRLEPDDRVATLRWIAQIEETRQADLEAAFEALAEAYRISEAEPEIEAEVERLAGALGAFEALADLFGEATGFAPDRAAALYLKVAQIAEERLADPARAVASLRDALEVEPELAVALDGLERLHAALDQPAALVEILERKAELAQDAEGRRALWVRVARLQAGPLGAPAEAIETWRRVLAEAEADEEALDALEELLHDEARWAELAAHLEHTQEVSSGEGRTAVSFRLAEVCRLHLQEGGRALGLYREVLAAQPDHPGANRALSALFDDPDAAAAVGVERAELAVVLEPLRRAAEDAAGLVAVLEVQREAADDPARQRALLLEIADLRAERLNDPSGAFDARGAALLVAPEDAEGRRALHRLAGETYRYDDLAGLLEAAAAEALEPSLRIALLMELGQLEEQHRGQDARAREVYREVLGLEPGHAGAIDALVELYSRTAAWEDLVSLSLELAAEAEDVEGQKLHLFKACQLLEDVVDDLDRAAATYRQVLEIEPENLQAFRALERFFTGSERFDDLARLLSDRIEHCGDADERARLRLQLAGLQESSLDDVDGALQTLATLLEEDRPGHLEAIERLERLLVELEAPHHQLQIVELLEPYYAQQGQWSDWINTHEVRLSHEPDRWQQVDLLTRIAKTHEVELKAPGAAFAALARAFAIDYGNPDLQQSLDTLAESLGAWEPLVDTYLAGIEDYADLDGAVSILLKVAAILDRRLDERDRAIACYERVLLVDDANATALDALERLLEAEGRFEGLVATLVRKADLSVEPALKRALLYRIAGIQEETLDQVGEAIATFRQIFDEDPADETALDALIRLYERQRHWTQLVLVLREKLELAESDGARKAVLERIALVYELELEDMEETIATWRSVLDADSRDKDALEALDRLYSREGRWGELVDLLEGERDALLDEDREAADALELRIADILEHRQGQVAQAIERYADLLERPSTAAAARGALERLLGDEAHRLAAGRVLEPHYEAAERPEDLARIYELQLLDIQEPVERQALLKRLAELRYAVLKHPRSAFDSYARAFEEDPSDLEVSDALGALADELSLHADLAALIAARLPEVSDGATAVVLNRRLAQLYDHKLQEHRRAVDCWQAVLEVDGHDEEALVALDRLHQAHQDWPALIEVVRRRIDTASDGESTDLRFRLGYLVEVVEGDQVAAIDLYRSVVQDDPHHAYSREALERLAAEVQHRRLIADVLEPVYRDTEKWDKLVILTEMRVEIEADPRERSRLWLLAAELWSERCGDDAHALDRLLRAIQEQPEDLDIRERLVRLGTARGAYEALTDAFEAISARIEDPDLKLADHLDMARWARVQLKDLDRAVGHFRAALELSEDNAEALDALEALHAERGEGEALADILERRAGLSFDLDEKRRRYLQLGALAADTLGDLPRAVAAYEQVLELDDADEQALAALETLHTTAADWPALLGVLERRADTTYDGQALAAIHRRMAELARDQIGDLELAASAFERVLDLEPDARPVMDALRALYERSEAWERLQDVLVKLLSVAEEGADRRGILRALGDNAAGHLGRLDEAVEYLRQVFSLEPANEAVFAQLCEIYSRGERWFDLVEALREHLAAARLEPAQRVARLVQLASLAERELQDADLAIESLNEVLAVAPNHAEALGVLARLYERSGEWDKAAEALQRSLPHAAEGAPRAAAHRQLGLLYLERLGDRAQGEAQLVAALDAAEDPEALAALTELARRDGDDARILALSERALAGLEGQARLAALKEVAALRKAASDKAGWLTALEEAQALAPEDLDLTDALIDAHLEEGRLDAAAPLLDAVIARLEAARRNKDLFRYNFRRGKLAEAQGDEAAALEAYTRVFEFDATFVPNLVALGSLHVRAERWADGLRIFQTVLLHQTKLDNPGRVHVFHSLGLIRQAMGEARKARDMFNRALGLDPEHTASQEALAALEA